MPTVGTRKFAYTPGGQQQATSFAQRTGQRMQMPAAPALGGGGMGAPAAAPRPMGGARPSPTAARPSTPKAKAKTTSGKSKGSSKK